MFTRSILLLSFLAATATAQSDTTQSGTPRWAPEAGTHIRGYLLRPDSTPINGWVLRYDNATAALSTCAGCDVSMYVPIDSVLALEEEHLRGKYNRGNFAGHLIVSIGVGALAGTGIAALKVASEHCHGDLCGLDAILIPMGTLVGGAAGLVAGLVSGLVAEDMVWTPVRRP